MGHVGCLCDTCAPVAEGASVLGGYVGNFRSICYTMRKLRDKYGLKKFRRSRNKEKKSILASVSSFCKIFPRNRIRRQPGKTGFSTCHSIGRKEINCSQ